VETLRVLINYAVGQYGKDRVYSIRFGASTPSVTVYEDTTDKPLVAEVWDVNGVINEKRFY
jgi:hypothetical protein